MLETTNAAAIRMLFQCLLSDYAQAVRIVSYYIALLYHVVLCRIASCRILSCIVSHVVHGIVLS